MLYSILGFEPPFRLNNNTIVKNKVRLIESKHLYCVSDRHLFISNPLKKVNILEKNISSVEKSITDLGNGKAFALHNILQLDGRVSAYPKSTRGFSSMNCYLLCENNAAILLDTGFNGQLDLLSKQISSVITQDTPLSIYPLRQNEFKISRATKILI